MKKSRNEVWARLVLGTLLNVIVLLALMYPSLGRGAEPYYHHNLLLGSLAAGPVVSMVPAFWCGCRWQGLFAALLIWLPGWILCDVLRVALGR
jgi:hypothetical protein